MHFVLFILLCLDVFLMKQPNWSDGDLEIVSKLSGMCP